MMVINNAFNFGDHVYLVTDVDQKERIVTGICIRPGGCISYEVTCGMESRWHYDFEISTEVNEAIRVR